MSADPAFLLVEDILAVERALAHLRLRPRDPSRLAVESDCFGAEFLARRLRGLQADLRDTCPTSAIGAAAILRVLMRGSMPCAAAITCRLTGIAARLAAGRREQDDLMRLRRIRESLVLQGLDDDGARLFDLVIRGAARPVLVYRAAEGSAIRPLISQAEPGGQRA